ncbi:hypothetical protein [Moorena sp. SIOASIH]|uniref:hypothetical protein n=1 Tax=Moorena sp. SIOASIH TaxID=2607817 RepID=UPI0025D8AFFE|nr:hypothetical protein [Moorena sp. SIOASIH]
MIKFRSRSVTIRVAWPKGQGQWLNYYCAAIALAGLAGHRLGFALPTKDVGWAVAQTDSSSWP